ncbi:LysR family transcriptional regulator [Actinoplanes sp. SE50]|uniref:LysR substrate-binding domain-containing protein n=1 Tax=unclassified Actinoplanes TaxID=2626549 RepID=UPI00023EC0FD|nr:MULTISPECIES: LysR substrate-binding domain-containing protein [unclassified Actinoplanes]AEV85180.1 putative RuBisCO transcriptional regulator [Actinoplanes sp. SE50/110]ATO83575.1 LysR family transcriptional regulator [Actinoplanes sp. SE50]SLM00982.1 LysR-family transcriptional regulator [Actinoplanes sp. SE50/110]
MLDVRKLLLFCDLERLGTIAAVAAARAYTPSAVSQQLAALEREAGVPLLERTGRRVTFTAAGRILARHATAVLATLEEADAALAAVRTGPAGPIRIGAFPSAMRALLPQVLVALGRDHPALELTVTELDPVAVPAALLDRSLDVGLLNDYDIAPAGTDPALESVPLLQETVYLAVPAPAGAGTLAAAADLPWILATPGTLCHEVTLLICRTAGFRPQARHHADDFATVLALVAAGQGVSIVPELAVPAAPAGVRLTALDTRRRTRIAYRRGAATHPAVAAVITALDTATRTAPTLSGAPR